MHKRIPAAFASKLLIFTWIITSSTVFMYYPGATSVLYGSTFSEWPSLPEKLERIRPLVYTADLLRASGSILIYTLLTVATGIAVLRLLRTPLGGSSERGLDKVAWIATAFLLGQGTLSAILLTLAIVGWLTPPIIAISLTLVAIGSAWPVHNLLHRSRPFLNLGLLEARGNRIDKILLSLALVITLASLLYSTSRLSYDSVALYFSDAKITALDHQIQFFLDDSFIVSSFQTGIQYSAVIALFGDQAARLYSWVNGVAIIAFTLVLAKELGFSRRAQILAFVLIITSTAFLDLMGDGKIDLASTAPAMGTVYWLTMSRRIPSTASLLLAGLFAGLAMIGRPFYVFLLALFIGVFCLHSAYVSRHENDRWVSRGVIRPLMIVAACAAALVAYHLVDNWAILGNPLAPFLNYQKLGASTWQWQFDPSQLWLVRAAYPLSVTYINSPQSLGNISPLVIAFLPLLLIGQMRASVHLPARLVSLGLAALVTLFLWVFLFFTVVELRYVLFLWIVLFLPVALLLESALGSADLPYRFLTAVVIVAVLAFIAIRTVYVALDTYSPVDAKGNAHCYDNSLCTFLQPLNQLAAPGDRVLTFSAFRYYLRSDLFACSTTHEEYGKLQSLAHANASAFWEEVYRQGYQYMAYEENYSERHLYMTFVPSPKNAPPWLQLILVSSTEHGRNMVYKIETMDPPAGTRQSCKQGSDGVWRIVDPP